MLQDFHTKRYTGASFSKEYREESRWLENSYKGPDAHWIRQQWKRCRTWFAEQTAAQFPSQWVSTLCLQRLDQMDVLSWQWIDYHERIVVQVWHTKQGVFRRFFFELMPFTLEALTVIKTYCL